MFRAKKIQDDYDTLNRAGQVTLIRLCTGHNILNSHMHRNINPVPSPLCTCGTEDKTTEHIRQRCPAQHINIPNNRYSHTKHHYTISCMGGKED